MIQYKYFSDGNIVISHPVPYKHRRADGEFFVCEFPDLVKKKIDGSGYFLPDGTAISGSEWVDKICELRRKAEPKKKVFSITQKVRRKISSSVAKMAESKQKHENLIFLTLTFPMFISEREANICWSKFAENLKLNYELSGYVTVKELTKIGRPHFHCILKIPFKPIQEINGAWCATWRHLHKPTPNAVQTDPKKPMIIRSVRRAVAYVAKYASKAAKEGVKYTDKCYFIDQSSLDIGTVVSDALVNFLLNYHACEKNRGVREWKSDKFPVEIWCLTDFYHTFDFVNEIFQDNDPEKWKPREKIRPNFHEF